MSKPKDRQLSMLDEAIDEVFNEMRSVNADSAEYGKMQKQVTKLMKLRSELNERSRVSPDTRATILAHLAGIAIIVGHERAHVITSQALKFLSKLR